MNLTVLHFAQTLDGRIATVTGHSKWISNDEDLIHAHRMRALCDAVLIGANTLRKDKPMLTVRHVRGPEPTKVVVGNNAVEFSSLLDNGGKVIYLSASEKNGYSGIEQVHLGNSGKAISPCQILQELFSRNIFSLYVEGGSITASGFMRDYAIDYMQLFLSPKIFGSGISNFSLPEISQVENSIKFKESSFVPMGDGVLFCGFPQ